MPKQKTHKGLTKRVKVTRSGKVKFRHVGKGHLNAHKSSNRKRKLGRTGVLSASEGAKVRRLLGHR